MRSKITTILGMTLALVFLFTRPALAQWVMEPGGPNDEYDRLDGKGRSQARVDVIEWEDNLEIHTYPGGMLSGLALKLDKREKDKPVMVIGYRFKTQPKMQFIRRAVLGISIQDGFKVYRDPNTKGEYDKIIVSNTPLKGNYIPYKLDPAPTQLYPSGHPSLDPQLTDENSAPEEKPVAAVKQKRAPAKSSKRQKKSETPKNTNAPVPEKAPTKNADEGSIGGFNF